MCKNVPYQKCFTMHLKKVMIFWTFFFIFKFCRNGSGIHVHPPWCRESSSFPVQWFLFCLTCVKAERNGRFYQDRSSGITSSVPPTGFPKSQKKGRMNKSTSYLCSGSCRIWEKDWASSCDRVKLFLKLLAVQMLSEGSDPSVTIFFFLTGRKSSRIFGVRGDL